MNEFTGVVAYAKSKITVPLVLDTISGKAEEGPIFHSPPLNSFKYGNTIGKKESELVEEWQNEKPEHLSSVEKVWDVKLMV